MKPNSNYGNIDEDPATHQSHVARMREYYAKTAAQYNTWHCNFDDHSSHNYAVREIVGLLDRVKATSVLDVCCGTGRAVKTVLDLGYQARGIDVSPDLIQVGIDELGIPRGVLEVGDATALPYRDKEFDVACILGALHHTARPRAIIAEMLRVSRKGIVISDEGNHFSGGIKAALVSLGIFDPVYRLLFRREPRQHRRQTTSDGDGPTFVFSVEEVIPEVREAFPEMKTLTFYRFGRFQTCAYWYPRLFARQVVVVASGAK